MFIEVVSEGDKRGISWRPWAPHEHYVSGGSRLGWVVTVINGQGQIQAVKSSDSFLQGFALQPPPKKRK